MSEAPPDRHYSYRDFLVILVLYRTVLEDSTSFRTLSMGDTGSELIDLVVYDNTPESQERPEFFESNGFKIQYISDTSNPGIGKAYNRAVEIAKTKNKKWILFLDQDTQIAKDMLPLFLEHVNQEHGMHVFGTTLFGSDDRLISPSKYRFKRGFRMHHVPSGLIDLARIRPINSLLLLSIEVFNKVGGYNEKIKLDFSDHEFLGRVQKIYKQMFVIPADNRHSLSTSDDTNLESIKTRFKIFCEGAHIAGSSSFFFSIQYFIVCKLRAIKLSLQFRTLFFIKVLLKEWIRSV